MDPSPEDGASSVEYALMVAAIAAVIVLLVVALGSVTRDSYTDSCTKLSAKMGGTCYG